MFSRGKWCRDCFREYDHWYYRNKPGRRASVRQQAAALRLANARKLWDYLEVHACVDCGEGDPIVLQFDHVRGQKKKAVTRLLSYGWSTIEREIAKCEVRCAHCHIRRTAKLGGWYQWRESGDVAQMEERLVRNEQATSSSLVFSTNGTIAQ